MSQSTDDLRAPIDTSMHRASPLEKRQNADAPVRAATAAISVALEEGGGGWPHRGKCPSCYRASKRRRGH